MNLVKMIYGSHLYGTNTEKSDIDYKGVYLPNIDDCILGKVQKTITNNTGDNKTKNTENDIDDELYSLQYFIKLASNGETVAIDMLHAPDRFLIETSSQWRFIRDNRSKFYSKNIKAFTGFARNQAKKYSVKGDRLEAVEIFKSFIMKYNDSIKFGTIFNEITPSKYITFTTDEYNKVFVDILGRKFSEDVSVKYVKQRIDNIIETYGKRAIASRTVGGADWKAISHAVRVALEVSEIIETNDLIFPLNNAEFLLSIKNGELEYDYVMNYLDCLISDIDNKIIESDLPEKVDIKFWENCILNFYHI